MITPEWPTDRRPEDLALLLVEYRGPVEHSRWLQLEDECSGWVEVRGTWWEELRMWWANIWWGHRVRLFGREGY